VKEFVVERVSFNANFSGKRLLFEEPKVGQLPTAWFRVGERRVGSTAHSSHVNTNSEVPPPQL
jgi:hypothetical protein